LQRWTKASACSLVGILVLAFYPEELRQSTPGELLTIAVGVLFLFGLVWALGTTIAPSLDQPFEDIIDDLVAAYQWEKAHTDPSGPSLALDSMLEKLLTLSLVRWVLRWLNPRRHPWTIAILLGVFMGITLLLSEMSSEEGSPQLGKLAMVAAVFIGAECGGVLLGYVLLAKPLGLFRQDSRE
jgi:drug/metabolite transporter (DMT)-like permease